MDRYTPCISRPTEMRARRMNMEHRRPQHETVLRHFSSFLENQESSIAQLMRNFDIDSEGDVCYDRLGISDFDASTFSSTFGNRPPSSSPELPPASESDNPHSIHPSAPVSRPGRLSPTIIQMILSSNTSTISGISSAADTSYDSGLYQWLGVDMHTCAPRSSSSSISASFPENFEDSTNLDMSMMSSRSAYSQPSSESRIVLPLSPPATAVPPFSNTLDEEATADSLPPILDLIPHHITYIQSNQIDDLRDFTTPMLSNNLSFRHHVPSASVLKHFQEVIDELRGLYVPNDTGNNAPNPDRARALLYSRRSRVISPPRSSHGCLSHSPLNSLTPAQSSAVLHPAPTASNHIYRFSRTTPELYTELAVMLFSQVSEEEEQVTNLRNLVNKLETLAIRKRKVALMIGAWGREKR